jgi:hypothetical protein
MTNCFKKARGFFINDFVCENVQVRGGTRCMGGGTNVLFVPPKVLKFFLVPSKKFSLYFDISFILKDKRISLYFDPLFIGVFLFQFDCLRVKRAPIKIKNKK